MVNAIPILSQNRKKRETQLLLLETNNPKSYALIGAKICCNYEGTIGIS